MPAKIVLAYDDPEFLQQALSAFNEAGHELAPFIGSAAALRAMENGSRAELLITPIRFRTGQPTGISLALRARRRRPGLRIIFIATPEMREYAEDLGKIVMAPVEPGSLVAAAQLVLQDGTRTRRPLPQDALRPHSCTFGAV